MVTMRHGDTKAPLAPSTSNSPKSSFPGFYCLLLNPFQHGFTGTDLIIQDNHVRESWGEKKRDLASPESLFYCPKAGCFGERQPFPTRDLYLWQKCPSFLQFPPHQGPPSPKIKVSVSHLIIPCAMGTSGWNQGLSAKSVAEENDSFVSLPCYSFSPKISQIYRFREVKKTC